VVPLSEDVRMVPCQFTVTKVPFPKVIPKRLSDVPVLPAVQVVPLSVDLTMFPPEAIATKVLFPNPTPENPVSEFEVLVVQVVPSGEVIMVA
jgi:hypothetical protein